MQTVSHVMTRDVQFVTPQETVRSAAQMMEKFDIGALPVCEGERLIGIVTDRDIAIRAASIGLPSDDALVDDVMSTDVRVCQEDQSVDEVMQQMADTQIRRMPVVSSDGGRLIGIISLADLITRTDDAEQKQRVGYLIGNISFPSEPDRSRAEDGANPDMSGRSGTASFDDEAADSDDAGNASTRDPSDVVEVAPEDLLNINSPDNRPLPFLRKAMAGTTDEIIVRHIPHADEQDTSTGESGAPGGIDAAGASGASGGTAGVAASFGTTRPSAKR